MKTATKKVIIGVLGGLVLLAGIAMIVLPEPAFVVIPAGLTILATEFEWAERWKRRFMDRVHRMRDAYRRHREEKECGRS